MKRLLLITLLFTAPIGCGTARGLIDATRSLGAGVLNDMEATVEGISEADNKRAQIESK